MVSFMLCVFHQLKKKKMVACLGGDWVHGVSYFAFYIILIFQQRECITYSKMNFNVKCCLDSSIYLF